MLVHSPQTTPAKHSYAIKPVPKPVPAVFTSIRPVINLWLENYDTAACLPYFLRLNFFRNLIFRLKSFKRGLWLGFQHCRQQRRGQGLCLRFQRLWTTWARRFALKTWHLRTDPGAESTVNANPCTMGIWITKCYLFAIQMPGNNLLFRSWLENRT